MRPPARRALPVATAVVVLGALASAVPALAGTAARADAVLRPATGSWGAAAGPVGAAPAAGAGYTVTWTPPVTTHYFAVTNTRTLPLTGATYTLTNTKPTNGTAPPEVALDACVGAPWNASTGACTGTVVRLASTSGGTASAASSTAPVAAGSSLSVRLAFVTLLNFPQSFSTTVGVSVTRAQVRAAVTTTG